MSPVSAEKYKIMAMHEQPINSIDVIGVGSSHMEAALDARLMYEEYGLNAYNCGISWQKFDTSYLVIEDVLKTQSPKLAVIDTYMTNVVKEDTDVDGETLYTRYLHAGKKEYLTSRFQDNLLSYAGYLFPLITFHERWNRVSESELFNRVDYRNEFRESRGQTRVGSAVEIQLPDNGSTEQMPIDDKGKQMLDDLLSICYGNDVKVLFVTIPMSESNPYSDAYREYSDQNGCDYIDFTKLTNEIGISETEDFYDEAHMNVYGAAKLSSYLAQYIISHYDI